jgi:hypothetical protein
VNAVPLTDAQRLVVDLRMRSLWETLAGYADEGMSLEQLAAITRAAFVAGWVDGAERRKRGDLIAELEAAA